MPSRRAFLQTTALATTAVALKPSLFAQVAASDLLTEFNYADVTLPAGPMQAQFEHTRSVLLGLNEDSLLKPYRMRAGLPAPGPDMGGWYDELPLERAPSGGHGFAPGHSLGQWISALSRGYAIDHDPATKAKIDRLLTLYEPTISPKFYTNFRFPAYNYEKLVGGLVDAHRYAQMPQAMALLDRTTDAALPHLPTHALNRDDAQKEWRASIGESTQNDYLWDESYTLPENLYLATASGMGARYKQMASRYLLDETWFNPLSENENVLPGHHAYSFFNSLNSAAQAYLQDGSQKHLRAAVNAFDMILATQSFATGGWGPNEAFVKPGTLNDSLTTTHRGFETPCGSYAHAKLTRSLFRITRDGKYGDSIERVLYNTILGARPLQPDGQAFYYSDYESPGASKVYFADKWPCCSGTFPQVAADFRILSHFRDPQGVYINLYHPATARWLANDGAQLSLTTTTNYPFESNIALKLEASKSTSFNLRLRIPAWAQSANPTIRVNGKPAPLNITKGFASINRKWKSGDIIDLNLPLTQRLEAIEPAHPNTVALMRGPVVLFATGEGIPMPSRAELTALSNTPASSTTLKTSGGVITFKPFTAIASEAYTTYFNVT